MTICVWTQGGSCPLSALLLGFALQTTPCLLYLLPSGVRIRKTSGVEGKPNCPFLPHTESSVYL